MTPYENYETAFSIDGDDWSVLERYDTVQQAKEGHSKYENMSKQELLNFNYIG